jgi:AhpC/TSA family
VKPYLLAVFGLLAAACVSPPPDGPLAEGSDAPSFALPSAEGTTVRLTDYLGKKPVLLYFSMGPG